MGSTLPARVDLFARGLLAWVLAATVPAAAVAGLLGAGTASAALQPGAASHATRVTRPLAVLELRVRALPAPVVAHSVSKVFPSAAVASGPLVAAQASESAAQAEQAGLDPQPRSGRQESLERLVGSYT